jgi:acyl-lipid omega-6 desaturase (Delta-12 desaturase)
LKKGGGLQAAVLSVTPPILDDEDKRKQMSEDYGFAQIGEHLPDNITLKDVMDTLPKEVPTANASMLFYVSYAQILT